VAGDPDNETPQPGDSGESPGDDEPSESTPPPYELPFVSELPQGTHVATLQGVTPLLDEKSFLIRGTFPIPRGLYSLEEYLAGISPFSVVDGNGTPLPTQVELVSRFADNKENDAENYIRAVEVLARTPYEIVGRQDFHVIYNPHAGLPRPLGDLSATSFLSSSPTSPSDLVLGILQAGVQLRARDVFGNQYSYDLFSGYTNVTKYGSERTGIWTYGVLEPGPATPLGAPTGALPHLFGVHSFISHTKAENHLRIDLHIHNGFSNRNEASPLDDPVNDIYFQDLEVVYPSGTQLLFAQSDPAIGEVYSENGKNVLPLIKPLTDGTVHYFKELRSILRSFAVVPSGPTLEARAQAELQDNDLFFARKGVSEISGQELYSFFHHEITGYYPQSFPAPQISQVSSATLIDESTKIYNDYTTAIASESCLEKPDGQGGTKCVYPFLTPTLGFWQPNGIAYKGMTGGTGIRPWDGLYGLAAADTTNYRHLKLYERTRIERQEFMFDEFGNPAAIEQFLKEGSCGTYAPVRVFAMIFDSNYCAECDPTGRLTAPTYQVDYAINEGLIPLYQEALDEYSPGDHQHYIREFGPSVAALYQANDPLSRSLVHTFAEMANLSVPNYPLYCSGSNPFWTIESLGKKKPKTPGTGVIWGRGDSWPGLVLTTAYQTSTDNTWRANKRESWFTPVFKELMIPAQVECNGFIQKGLNKNTDNKFYYQSSMEGSFGQTFMYAALQSVYLAEDQTLTEEIVAMFLKSMIGFVDPSYSWDIVNDATPHNYLIMSDANDPDTIFCSKAELSADALYYLEKDHNYGEFAYNLAAAYYLSKSNIYLLAGQYYLMKKDGKAGSLKELLHNQTHPYYLSGWLSSYTGPLLGCVESESACNLPSL
ncbi:MAG: hypothetical protein KDD55_09125, partial [Bdellovibrionales bacterium]|nr:hypothetical protein [Bdellovibrionales bacterium]